MKRWVDQFPSALPLFFSLKRKSSLIVVFKLTIGRQRTIVVVVVVFVVFVFVFAGTESRICEWGNWRKNWYGRQV